jgi:hypothetical protein
MAVESGDYTGKFAQSVHILAVREAKFAPVRPN